MIGKNYSKQILDYLTDVIVPQTSKEILANTNIPKEQITVYLNRLKNRDKIWVVGKVGSLNKYMIGPKDSWKFIFEQALGIYDKHYDVLFPSEKKWLEAYRKDLSINKNLS